MARFETPGAVRLRVVLGAGEVTVETGDTAEVVVDVLPQRDDKASREAASETRVEHRESGGAHEIAVEVPKRWGFAKGRDASVSIQIRCPHGTGLVLAAASADLDAQGRLGDVRVKSASGDTAVQVVEGSLRVSTASGDVSAADVAGGAKVNTASGDVDLKRVGGDLDVGVVSGDLVVGEALGAVAVSTVSGDVRIGAAGGGNVELKSVSGDIEIGMRPGLRLWIDANSLSGSMMSELAVTDARPAEDAPLVEVRAKSVSGDVRIRRAVEAGRSL